MQLAFRDEGGVSPEELLRKRSEQRFRPLGAFFSKKCGLRLRVVRPLRALRKLSVGPGSLRAHRPATRGFARQQHALSQAKRLRQVKARCKRELWTGRVL
jgi:hypothetical protein